MEVVEDGAMFLVEADPKAIRCPGCDKLLAMIAPRGAEVKRDGRILVVLSWGQLKCFRCGTVLEIRDGRVAHPTPP